MAWTGSFDGKVVLVTGASSGIGRETALAFGAAGARLVLVARRLAALEEVARRAALDGAEALPVPADVTRAEDVRACFDTAAAHFGRVDIVVNNAGILVAGPVVDLEARDLDAMLRVNLFGALFVMQEAVRLMRRQGEGTIVNVASLAGRRGVTPLGGYCATKFALIGLTEALRTELYGERIHVGLVLPGVVETPMVERVGETAEALWPTVLNMPPAWVVWAVLTVARLQLAELSVPPGAGTIEKLGALAPSATDAVIHWGMAATRRLATWLRPRRTVL